MDEQEVRYIACSEIRAEQKEGEPTKLIGYAIVYNRLSEDLGGFRERVAPGSIQNLDSRILAYAHHNREKVLGSTRAGTLKLQDTETGLYCEIIPPANSYGKDIVESVQRGDLDGMSFRFNTIKDSWDHVGGEDVRTLEQINIGEVSIVSEPAYPDTTIALRELKKLQESQQDNQARSIDRDRARLRLAELEVESAE